MDGEEGKDGRVLTRKRERMLKYGRGRRKDNRLWMEKRKMIS